MQEVQFPGINDSGFDQRKHRSSPSYAGARAEVAILLHEGPIVPHLAPPYAKQPAADPPPQGPLERRLCFHWLLSEVGGSPGHPPPPQLKVQ